MSVSERSDELSGLSVEVRALGLRIAEQLARHSREDDLLSTWIGMRLAELMTAAEDDDLGTEERQKAAAECSDLILAVWKHRSHWPQGWPPSDVGNLLGTIDGMLNRWSRSPAEPEAGEETWVNTLGVALDSLDREREVWLRAALVHVGDDELEIWLESPELAQDEADLLRKIIDRAKTAADIEERIAAARPGRSRRPTPDLRKVIVKQIRELTKTRLDLARRCADGMKES